MTENPTFQIPKDVIEPIIQAHVTAAVTAALADKDQIISQLVSQLLNRKVDNDGKDTTYSHYSTTWMQWVMRKCVQQAVLNAIEGHLASHQKKIEQYLLTELKKSNSPMFKDLVAGMLGALTHPSVAKYRLTVVCEDK